LQTSKQKRKIKQNRKKDGIDKFSNVIDAMNDRVV
jgi:hypothetical protein